MKSIRILPAFFLLVLWLPIQAQNAPYVNTAVADSVYATITADDMDALRDVKVLFASRSWGLNMRNGLEILADQDATYDLLTDYVRYDVFNAGGDVTVIPVDAFDNYNFVHFLATASPPVTRLNELAATIRNAPHYFQDDIQAAMVYHSNPGSGTEYFDTYTGIMDSLRAEFPHIMFIYTTAGYYDSSDGHAAANAEIATFNGLLRAAYRGVVPLYDHAYLNSDDGRCGDAFCPEFSTDPAGVHPNTDEGQIPLGKGFIVMLHKLFRENPSTCAGTDPGTVPSGLSGSGTSLYSTRITWNASAHATCGIKKYLVRREGADIGESFGTGFCDFGLEENTEYSYSVASVAENDVVSAYCTAAAVRTFNDTTAPEIAEVPTTIIATQVTVRFSENLDEVSAENAGNYRISDGITVLGAELTEPDLVTLTTSTLSEGTDYTLAVAGVKDLSVNGNEADDRADFKYSFMTVDNDYVTYLDFDNNITDRGPAGNDGTGADGGPVYSGISITGQALDLDGAADGPYVSLSDDPTLDAQPAMSVCLWAKKKSADTGGQILHKHVAYVMNAAADGLSGYVFNIDGVRCNYSASSVGINDTEWHHYAITHDGDSIRIWVDGVVVTAEELDDSVANGSAGLYLGKDPWGGTFSGYLDEFRVYHWALSAAEINELMTGASVNRDSLAVRALLDANGDSRLVSGTATFDSAGRVTRLNIQTDLGGTVPNLTYHIGQLTELQLLHVYGPAAYDHGGTGQLTTIDPAIGNCSKLTELLLNDNDLADLPPAITALTNLDLLSVGNNLLCGVDDSLRGWLDANDPDWESTQVCDTTGIVVAVNEPQRPAFSVAVTGGRIVAGLPGMGRSDVTLYSFNGQPVYSVQGICRERVEIGTGNICAGVYLIEAVSARANLRRKILLIK